MFLPIHAAGDYDSAGFGDKLSDYVVSSYTLTLTALLDHLDTVTGPFKPMTVAQRSAPGAPPIRHTMDEVDKIRNLAENLPILSLTEEKATVEQVLQGMRECNWVHLACHGRQNLFEPMKSCLLLHDGPLPLSTVIYETFQKADFAFLSACQTAMGDEYVAEESVHLAAGMAFAGYKGVIATMWSIKDEDGPKIAENVYRCMLKDGKPDRKRAAHGLHEAAKRLRESGSSFMSWIPFIHIGR